ncbi:MAG: hypothetical protein LBN93_09190 [Candidatus Symbiothrix sp.]|jgi:outer membrane protein OmpA-like peptidoglycan-associated protein|nr:hypothetical protein [Candidatus Symbiothrix sp.]
MKKRFYLVLTLAVMAVACFTSCKSNLKPLASDYIQAEPQPLELIAGQVPVTINVTFPANWFDKKATVVVTPVLRYNGGESAGSSYVFQGEKVAGNGQTISQKNGGNVVLKSSFAYIPAMQKSELYLAFKAQIGNKPVDLPAVKIGDGVLATAALLSAATEAPAIAADKFQRVTTEAYDANLLFLIQQADLRVSELKKADVTNWKSTVKSAELAPNQNVDIEISAYASPDGGYELNEKLSEKREANTKKYLVSELKKEKVSAPINAKYTAQDWDGFRRLVEKSNIQDKDLILRVLSMYSDSEQREREIKNISAVYSTLANEILPQLRRSRLTANVETIGKSDAEITVLAASNPRALTVEELLYAATLTPVAAQKATIYNKVIDLFPNDPRGYNNLGVVQYAQGKISAAEDLFKKATNITSSLPEANLNLGYVALANGNRTQAEQYISKAANAQGFGNAQGLLSVLDGNYAKAAQSFGSTASNNAALSQILSKDYNKASGTLNAIANPDATTDYLKAIVGARTNNLSQVTSNLKHAIAKDSSFATKALNDVEFAKYLKDSSFLNALK